MYIPCATWVLGCFLIVFCLSTGNKDAYQMMRVSVGLDEGFDRFSTIDPIIMADINQDGVISAFDAHYATRG